MPRTVRSELPMCTAIFLHRPSSTRCCKTDAVPWRPPSVLARNPRLDPYRHMAARFSEDSGRSGTFYVEPDALSTVRSGHLWWRRWSPLEEFVILWVETPQGEDTDTWILPDDLDDELTDWDKGQFRWIGETYRLTWLDDDATRALRRALQIEDVQTHIE